MFNMIRAPSHCWKLSPGSLPANGLKLWWKSKAKSNREVAEGAGGSVAAARKVTLDDANQDVKPVIGAALRLSLFSHDPSQFCRFPSLFFHDPSQTQDKSLNFAERRSQLRKLA